MSLHISKYDWKVIFVLREKLMLRLVGEEPYGYQKTLSNTMIESVILNDGHTLASEWSRQCGKTTCVVGTVVFLLLY